MVDSTLPPGSPTYISSTGGARKTTIVWNSPTDLGIPSVILRYKIYTGTASGALTYLAYTTPDILYFVHEGLLDDTTYYYQVSAVNASAVGEGPKSVETSAKTSTSIGADLVYKDIVVNCGMSMYPTRVVPSKRNVVTENEATRILVTFPDEYDSYVKIISIRYLDAEGVDTYAQYDLNYDDILEKYFFILNRTFTYYEKIEIQFRARYSDGQEPVDPCIIPLRFENALEDGGIAFTDSEPVLEQSVVLQGLVDEHASHIGSNLEYGHFKVDGVTVRSNPEGYLTFIGASGWSGAKGDSGYSGWSGINGESGYSGWSGINGESGYSGWSGQNGEQSKIYYGDLVDITSIVPQPFEDGDMFYAVDQVALYIYSVALGDWFQGFTNWMYAGALGDVLYRDEPDGGLTMLSNISSRELFRPSRNTVWL
jgi:hypothetical protein